MSCWTWTYQRVSTVSPEVLGKFCDDRIHDIEYWAYMRESKEEWVSSMLEDIDYLVEYCGEKRENCTPEKYGKKYNRLCKQGRNLINMFTKVKIREANPIYEFGMNSGFIGKNMSSLNSYIRYFDVDGQPVFYRTLKDKTHAADYEPWIQIHSPFRLSVYSKEGERFQTVDALMEHIGKPENAKHITSMNDNAFKLDKPGLTPEFAEYIRKYYTEIGDYNFNVHFG